MMNKKSQFFTIVLAFQIWALLLVFKNSIGTTANSVDYKYKGLINLVIPEGWGFFTRNPREETLDIYEYRNNVKRNLLTPNGEIEHYFGASRKNRRISMEISSVLKKVPGSKWSIDSTGEMIIPKEFIKVKREKNTNFLLGKYILVLQDKLPWAWAKHPERFSPVIKSVGVEIIN